MTTVFRALLIFALFVVAPLRATAQPWAANAPRGVTEVGVWQEWFHRELEPSLYADTRWSTTSLVFNYSATDWLNLGLQGGLANFETEDFPGSEFERFAVGASIGAKVYTRGRWDIRANGRYSDTFDLDTSSNLLHKRARSLGGSVNLAREMTLAGQAFGVWAGPTIVNDVIETFFYDSLDGVESTSGTALGVNAGARLVVSWIAFYGYASYVDDWQGGVGVSLHAKGGGF